MLRLFCNSFSLFPSPYLSPGCLLHLTIPWCKLEKSASKQHPFWLSGKSEKSRSRLPLAFLANPLVQHTKCTTTHSSHEGRTQWGRPGPAWSLLMTQSPCGHHGGPGSPGTFTNSLSVEAITHLTPPGLAGRQRLLLSPKEPSIGLWNLSLKSRCKREVMV